MQLTLQLPLYPMEKYIHIRGIYTFIYAERRKNFSFSGEKHHFWELVYADSGEVLVTADGKPCTLKQGDMIFHMPMEFHTIRGDNKHPHSVLIISFETDSPAMGFFERKVFSLDYSQRQILTLLFTEGSRFSFGGYIQREKLMEKEGLQSYQVAVNYLECLLIDLIRKNSGERVNERREMGRRTAKNSLADDINAYLEEHICSQLQLQDICRSFHMSRSQLCRIYRDATGTGVIDHYIDLKITLARHLIREGKLNYTQISEQLGFSGLHHFTRTFKQRTNMTPSAYDRSIRSEEWNAGDSQITPPL